MHLLNEFAYDIHSEDGREAIVYDYIEGKLLLDVIPADKTNVSGFPRTGLP